MNKADMNNTVEEVKAARNAMKEAHSAYLEEQERAAAEVEQLEEDLAAARQSKTEADTVEKVKESMKNVRDLEEQLDVTTVVNNTKDRNLFAELKEAVEETMKAYKTARAAYNKHEKEVKLHVSLYTLEKDNEALQEIAGFLNDTDRHIIRVARNAGIIEQGTSSYKDNGVSYHLAAAALRANLAEVFQSETVRYYKYDYNKA